MKPQGLPLVEFLLQTIKDKGEPQLPLFSSSCSNALEVAREMGESAFEAQSCYSLGSVYTLMQSYHKAIEYHRLHLQFAIQLGDR